jgi:hypothetical protein
LIYSGNKSQKNMGTLEEIKRMQKEGKTEQEINKNLQARGIPQKEILDAMAQSKIKDAVSGAEPSNPSSFPEESIQAPQGLMAQEAGAPPMEAQEPQQDYYQQQPQEPYPSYQPAQEQYQQPEAMQGAPQGGAMMSPDTITEIAEQVITEKFEPLRKKLEKVMDLKTIFESKTEYIDERLKRIEKIIDRLQLSILQKVGEYLTGTENLKKELEETQKSFKAVQAGKHMKSESSSESKEQKPEHKLERKPHHKKK